MLADGIVLFTGRREDLVLFNGTSINLHMIDSALSPVGKAATIVVSSRKDTIVTFIEDEKHVLEAYELAKRELPPHLVPSYILPITLPLLDDGTVDRRALEAVFHARTDREMFSMDAVMKPTVEDEKPETTLIRTLLSEISRMPVSAITGFTNIYEIGLDSISAIQLVWKLRRRGYTGVSVADVMNHPTAVALAKVLSVGSVRTTRVEVARREFVEVEKRVLGGVRRDFGEVLEVFPCTPLQEGMIAESLADEGVNQVNWNHTVLEVLDRGDVGGVVEGWKKLVERHAILRTSFVFVEEEQKYRFLQVVRESGEGVEVLEGGFEEVFEGIVGEVIGKEDTMRRPVKGRVVVDGTKVYFVMSLHHAVYDGWSLGILVDEFNGILEGRAWEPRGPTFREAVTWIRGLEGDVVKEFWAKHLDGVDPCLVRGFIGEGKMRNVVVERRTGLSVSKAEMGCRRLGTTMGVIVGGVWGKMVGGVFGMVWSGRTNVEGPVGVEEVVGPCFNTVPFWIGKAGGSLGEFVGGCHGRYLEVAGVQGSPLMEVQKVMGLGVLFDTVLVFQKMPGGEKEGSLKVVRDVGLSKFAIMLEVIPEEKDDGAYLLRATVDEDVFGEEEALEILANFDKLLEEMVTQPASIPVTMLSSYTVKAKGTSQQQAAPLSLDRSLDGEVLFNTKRMIREAIAQVSQVTVDDVLDEDSLFQLGMDSISVIRLTAVLRDRAGIFLSFLDIMKYPTVQQMATLWCSRCATATSAPSLTTALDMAVIEIKEFEEAMKPIVAKHFGSLERVSAILPCVPIQSAMIAQTLKDPKAYFNLFVYELEGNADVGRLRDAWMDVVKGNDVLRTRFLPVESTFAEKYDFMQVVMEDLEVVWTERSVRTDGEVEGVLADVFEEQVVGMKELQGSGLAFTVVSVASSGKIHFALNIHHALYDGWSLRILLDQVASRYNGMEVTFQPDSFSYMVTSILANLQEDGETSRREFWMNRLDSVEPSPFPDLSGTTDKTPGRLLKEQTLKMPLSDIEEQCRVLGVTVQAVSQATWALLLRSYLDTEDVVFGHVLSGRTVPAKDGYDLGRVVGPCLVTVPCRVREGDEVTNLEIVEGVLKQNLEVHAVQHVPLRDVNRWIGLRPGTALFDTIFLYQKTSIEDDESDKLPWKEIDGVNDVEYAIAVEFEPNASNELVARISAKRTVLSELQASLILRQLEALFNDILNNPKGSIGSLSTRISHDLTSILNADAAEIPKPAGICYMHSWVEHFASMNPTDVALEFASDDFVNTGKLTPELITYGDLNAYANKIAHRLREMGLKEGDNVPVAVDRSVAFYAAILGVSKAGGVYVPIETSNPVERKVFICGEVGAKFVVVAEGDKKAKEFVAAISTDIGIVYADTLRHQDAYEHNLGLNIDERGVAYILFTSGSTGTPKGVLVEHYNLVQSMLAFQQLIPLVKSSRFLQFASCSFDVSIFEMFLSWSFGACVCATTKDNLLGDLSGVIREFKVTHIDLTPSVATLVRRHEIPSLELLVSGGEAITGQVLAEWGDGKSLVNAFGPSEVTIGCTMLVGVTASAKPANIGRPFSNVSACIMSSSGTPVLTGAIGELYVGGPLVARGYLNRPEQTQASFIPLNLPGCVGPQPGYKTGDIGRFLADGTIEYLGRRDDQVKIRGMRLQLSEVNTVAASADESITSAYTLALANKVDGAASKQLVTFLVIKSDGDSSSSLLLDMTLSIEDVLRNTHRHCESKLPPYMVPNRLIPIRAIPLGATGKLDMKKLSNVFEEASERSYNTIFDGKEVEEDEWTETEAAIRLIIAETSRVSERHILKTTNIFELGIDSLTATHLARKLRNAGFSVQISEILLRPRVKDLLDFTIAQGAVSEALVSKPFEQEPFKEFTAKALAQVATLEGIQFQIEDIDKIYPCTPLQEGMIYTYLATNGGAYANQFELNVGSEIDITKLQEAWLSVINAHEILRTRFIAPSADEGYAQFVFKKGAFRGWSVSSVNTKIELKKAINAHGKSATLLEPLRLSLYEAATGERILMLDIHHALYDGWTLPALLGDVRRAYFNAQLPSRKPFQYVVKHIRDIDMASAKNFWTKALDSCTPALFPNITGLLPLSDSKDVIATRKLQVNARKLEDVAKELGVTAQTILVAAWSKILSNFVGESDVVFGQTLSGRLIPVDGIDEILGPCFNTIPVRVNLSTSQTNADLAKKIHRDSMEAISFQHTPLSAINSWMGLGDSQSLFNTLFLYQKFSTESDDLSGTPELWKPASATIAALDYPVSIEVEHNESGSLVLTLGCKTNFVPADFVEVLAKQFDFELSGFVSNLNKPAAAIDISLEEEDLFAIENSNFENCEAGLGLLHRMFETSVQRSPDQVALEWVSDISASGEVKSTLFTYLELNTNANRLARAILAKLGHLRSTPEAPIVIPIHIPKSIELYIAILAVLKSGCAYLPIDPQLPWARKQFLVEDVGSLLALTTKEYQGKFGPLCEVIAVDNPSSFVGFSGDNVDVEMSSSNLAYLLTTSGTTGTPKGVMIEHGNITQSVLSFYERIPFDFKPNSKFFQMANPSFDVSLYEMWIPWSLGKSICSSQPDLVLRDLEHAISSLGLTCIGLSPTLASLVRSDKAPSIELLLCGGEALTHRVLEEWGGSDGRLCNCYGPSECTVNALVNIQIDKNTHPSVIGRPQRTCSMYVMTENMTPALKGCIGELSIGGLQVARGYWNRPELTAAKFPTIQFEGVNDRVFMTGDLVRMLPDGSISFIGRKDDQVKRNGLRIELGEINATLSRAHEDIQDAVSMVLKHPGQQRDQIISFVSLSSSHPLSREENIRLTLVGKTGETEALQAALLKSVESLPSYMIPGMTFIVTRIPIGSTGKVDRKMLSFLYMSLTANELFTDEKPSPDAVWTEEELQIRRVLSKIAQISEEIIARDISFFQLGLDSISAIRFSSSLSQMHINASVSEILRYPTIGQLGRFISGRKKDKSVFASPTTQERELYKSKVLASLNTSNELLGDIKAVYPCTPLQEGMVAKTLSFGGSLYINSITLMLRRSGDIEKALEAWKEVVARNDILRTSFCAVETSFAQLIHSKCEIDVREFHGKIEDAIEQASNHIVLSDSKRPPIVFTKLQYEGIDYLIITLHHALYDGFSLSMMLDDAAAAYAGKLVARPPYQTLSEYITSQPEEESKVFWTQLLEGVEDCIFPNLTLPNAGSLKSSHGVEVEGTTSRKALDVVCRELGITMSSVFQAAWGYILSLYCGRTDIVFGNIVSGRSCPVPGIEEIMGPSFNTIPVRFDVSKFTSGVDLLLGVHGANMSSLEFQFTPLRSIIKWTRGSKLENRDLFDTLLSVLAPSDTTPSLNAPWSIVELDKMAELEYPISVEVQPTTKGITIRGGCKNSVMSEKHLHLLMVQFDQVIHQFTATVNNSLVTFGSMKLSELSIYNTSPLHTSTSTGNVDDILFGCFPKRTSDASKRRKPKKSILEGIMRWFQSSPKDPTVVHEIVEKYAVLTPNALAIDIASPVEERWTFEQLNSHANKVAHYLLSKGLRPEQLVPICMDRTALAYATVLGILKAGGAYVPIDLEASAERKNMIISDVNAPLVICSQAVFSTMQVPDAKKSKFIIADSKNVQRSISNMKTHNPSLQINANNLAYCLYTSGTSGTPKGCLVEHGNCMAALSSFSKIMKAKSTARIFQFASLSFDVSVAELFVTWMAGGTVVSASRDEALSNLEAVFNKFRITHAALTPTLAALLRPDRVPSLQFLSCGGEKLTQTVIDAWGPTGKLFNAYGPSEATIGVSLCPVSPDHRPSTLGKFFSTAIAYIVTPGSASLEILPRGAVGELCLSGPQVARGYLNRPALNESKFASLPPSKNISGPAKVYRTGDLARMLEDGQIEFLGRFDKQVKFNGIRIELDEITTAVVASTPSITDGVTIVGRHGSQSRDQLVAFVTCSEMHELLQGQDSPYAVLNGNEVTLRTAYENCRQKLSRYMVPAWIIPIDSIPKTIANKVDEKSLQSFFESLSGELMQDLSLAYNELGSGSKLSDGIPESEWEAALQLTRKILSKASGVSEEQILPSSSIFHLGLDSISVVRISAELKDEGIRIDASQILQLQTLEQITARICKERLTPAVASTKLLAEAKVAILEEYVRTKLGNAASKGEVAKYLGLSEDSIESILPTSAGQTFTISSWINSNGEQFSSSFGFVSKTCLQSERLMTAMSRILEKNSIFRTAFMATPDENLPFIQIVLKSSENFWTYEEHQEVEFGSPDALKIVNRIAEGRKNFDLLRPPFHVNLVHFANNVSLFAVTMHHALYDGWSLRLLLKDIQDTYLNDGKARDDEDSATFADFLLFSCGLSGSEQQDFDIYSPHREYWINAVSNVDPSMFPSINRGEQAVVPAAGVRDTVLIADAITDFEPVRAFYKNQGVGIQSVFAAAWAKIQSQYVKSDTQVFGIYNAGRMNGADNAGFAGLNAPCMNVVPLVVQNSTGELVELSKEVQKSLIELQDAKSQVPLGKISAWAGLKGRPMFNVCFNFLNFPAMDGESDGLFEPLTLSSSNVPHPIINVNGDVKNINSNLDIAKRNTVSGSTKVDMDVEVAIEDGKVTIAISHLPAMLSRSQAQALIYEMCLIIVKGAKF